MSWFLICCSNCLQRQEKERVSERTRGVCAQGQRKPCPERPAHLLSPLQLHSWAPGSSPVQNPNLGEHLGTDAHQARPRASQALSSAILFSPSECLSTSSLKHIYVRSFCRCLWQPVLHVHYLSSLSAPPGWEPGPQSSARGKELWFSFSPSHMFSRV